MAHRIRHAMSQPVFADKLGGTVEIDETYVGSKRRQVKKGSRSHRTPIVSLVERNGRVRSFVIPIVNAKNLKEMIRANVEPNTRIMTDSFSSYRGLHKEFASHETVNHMEKEYARGEVHTNTVEGYFSLLKRGLTGTFHHVSKHHLHRYLSEFDFRYNARHVDDFQRYMAALKATEGKRLLYKSAR